MQSKPYFGAVRFCTYKPSQFSATHNLLQPLSQGIAFFKLKEEEKKKKENTTCNLKENT